MKKDNKKSKLLNALSPRQQVFVLEYTRTGKAQESAIKAGYSPKCAHVQATRLLKNAKVQTILSTVEQTHKADLRLVFKEQAMAAFDRLLANRTEIELALKTQPDSAQLRRIARDIDNDILHLAGYKPTDRQEVAHKGQGIQLVTALPKEQEQPAATPDVPKEQEQPEELPLLN